MTIRLNGSSSGYTELDAPAVAGSNTLILPGGNGSADQALVTNGSGTLSWADRGRMVLGTAVASTSGTEIDFTGIPSWVKRIIIMFSEVSTAGSSNPLIQLGDSGGFETTGYTSTSMQATNGAASASSSRTDGFGIRSIAGSNTLSGHMVITLLGADAWVSSHIASLSSTATVSGAGSKTLSGTLDRIRITTGSGTDTFDAGSINILYEG